MNLQVLENIDRHSKKPKFWDIIDKATNERSKLIIKQLAQIELFQAMPESIVANIVSTARYDSIEKDAPGKDDMWILNNVLY